MAARQTELLGQSAHRFPLLRSTPAHDLRSPAPAVPRLGPSPTANISKLGACAFYPPLGPTARDRSATGKHSRPLRVTMNRPTAYECPARFTSIMLRRSKIL